MDASALSWKIAAEPSLYWKLVLNPYSSQALQIMSERFPNDYVSDVVVAVISAEPEGRYDRDFLHLPAEQKEVELYKQKDITAAVSKRLESYFKENARDLKKLPKEVIYDILFEVVFGKNDSRQIELLYSQRQRLDFKLSIINYVEALQKDMAPRNILLKMAFAALTLLMIFTFTQIQASKLINKPRPVNQTLSAETEKQFPVFLKIPSINIVASIQPVGLTPEGEMDVPKNIKDVGWYNLGPKPGEWGSSVIAGHFDGIYGEDAVFANLNKIKIGDKLYVEDNNGNSTVFEVKGTGFFDPGFAGGVFNQNDGRYLNLITCDGIWVGSKKSYSKRLVVFAGITH